MFSSRAIIRHWGPLKVFSKGFFRQIMEFEGPHEFGGPRQMSTLPVGVSR